MIDWDRIAELQAEVGEDGLAEVLDLFFEEFEEALQAHGSSASETLHFLKGSASNIGMRKVAQLCLESEAAIKAGQTEVADLSGIAEAFSQSRAELREVLAD